MADVVEHEFTAYLKDNFADWTTEATRPAFRFRVMAFVLPSNVRVDGIDIVDGPKHLLARSRHRIVKRSLVEIARSELERVYGRAVTGASTSRVSYE